jgi:hypothetical protein
MNELLQINGMTDVYFTTGNLITIVGGIIATAGTFWKLSSDHRQFKALTEEKTRVMNEEILASKNGRTAIRRELSEKIKEVDEHNRARIDKTQLEFKGFVDKTNAEFKEINSSLNKIIGLLEKNR